MPKWPPKASTFRAAAKYGPLRLHQTKLSRDTVMLLRPAADHWGRSARLWASQVRGWREQVTILRASYRLSPVTSLQPIIEKGILTVRSREPRRLSLKPMIREFDEFSDQTTFACCAAPGPYFPEFIAGGDCATFRLPGSVPATISSRSERPNGLSKFRGWRTSEVTALRSVGTSPW